MTDEPTSKALGQIPEHGHEPVMSAEVIEYLDIEPGQTVVDCTLGRGGHAALMAEKLGETGMLIGLDADPVNLAYAEKRLTGSACRLHLVHANFSQLPRVLKEAQVAGVDALLADLGVSTNQLLKADYGLSFTQVDAPLDMRLDPRIKQSGADLLRRWDEKRIADVLYLLAQERYSRRIARKIVERRGTSPIQTTGELAELVRRCVPWPKRGPRPSMDPATRTFMALRMAVNAEVDVLNDLLSAIPTVLRPGGRCAVISFHSGEDRLVKQAFRDAQSLGRLDVLTKKPLTPGEAELTRNPRARSAKLRAARRPL